MSSRRWSYAVCLPVVFLLVAGSASQLLSEPTTEPPSAPIVDPAIAEQLRALGYADWVDAGDDPALVQGVTLHESGLTYDGYNLYNSRWRDRAYLIDMQGEIAHMWFSPGLGGNWHHIEMLPSGDLLTIYKDGYLAKLDWNSKLLWKSDLFTHHDIATGDSGEIWVLTRDFVEIPHGDGKIPILDDYIVSLTAEGEVLRKVSMFEFFGDAVKESRFDAIARVMGNVGREAIEEKRSLLDLFHTNTLERLDRDIGGMKTRGDFLICPKHIDLVAIVDLETNRVEWSWGAGQLEGPHQPSVLSNGNILIFDNGNRRKYSRLVEVDPATNEIVWQYTAEPRESFYSPTRGGAQELPNGNILVTDSDKGRAFEITRDGRTVWEFYNPDLQKAGTMVRGAIYRMMRFDESAIAPLLASNSQHESTSAESTDGESEDPGGQ